jgi:hypothetical protein
LRLDSERALEKADRLVFVFTCWLLRKYGPASENVVERIRIFGRPSNLGGEQLYEAQIRLANTLAAGVSEGQSASRGADLERAEGLLTQALRLSPRYPLLHAYRGSCGARKAVLTKQSRNMKLLSHPIEI